jgi:competence protein ComEC
LGNNDFLRQAPFLRLIFPLIIGIVLRINFSIPEGYVFSLLTITFVAAFCFTIFEKLAINYRYRWIPGLSIHLIIFCLGVIFTDVKFQSFENKWNETNSPVNLIGIVSEPPGVKPNSIQCFVAVDQIAQGKQFSPSNTKILVYIQKDSNSLKLKAGDAIVMRLQLNKIKSTGNPFEFDYGKYLSYQGVHLSGYVNGHSWKLLTNNKLPFYQMIAYNVQAKLLSIFTKIGLSGDELGVTSALIIGDKTYLDDDIKQAYVASGTMHILAVSGMHVALLYWVLNMLLSFLERNKLSRIIKLILLLLAVWFYALITGLGGSILRAATMITFIIVGQSFNKNINIFNSLAVSAFLLLIINPFNLIDVGFQLSYCAVISIVIFYPFIYEIIDFNDWLPDQLWSLTAVTIAAQILTTPISLFYFHQFPNLFLVSNLVMIPLSTIIMYFVMVLLPLSGFNWLAKIMGKVLDFLVWLLNKVVLTIEHLPYALTKGVYITWLDVCLLYMFVCFVTLYLLRKSGLYFAVALSSIALLLLHGSLVKYQNSVRKEIVVYNDAKNIVIQFHNGNKSVWIVGARDSRIDRYMNIAIQARKVKENKIYFLDSVQQQTKGKGKWLESYLWVRGNCIQFFDKKIVISDGNEVTRTTANPIKADYLIVRDLKGSSLQELKNNYLVQLVVLNASIKEPKAKRAEEIFDDKKVPVYSIDAKGAWVFNLTD